MAHSVASQDEKSIANAEASVHAGDPYFDPYGQAHEDEKYVQSRGVTRMEAVSRTAQGKKGRYTLWAISASVIVCAWAYALDQSTTSSYEPLATSDYEEHSTGLATLSIATGIIGAVAKPFIAKISDITSRPYTYLLIIVLYIMGYVIIAASSTLSAYVVGAVFGALGQSGLDLLNDLIVADLTSLQWRPFISSLLSAPFIINTWYAGKIVSALSYAQGWRWGYGMFAIIMPVCLGPAIAVLIYLDRRAQKLGVVNIASSNLQRRLAREEAQEKGEEGPRGLDTYAAPQIKETWFQLLKRSCIEIDAFGLLLLGFGWSLLLLPFSLKTYAKGGWNNPSMIAMMVVGGVFLILYVLYERFLATFPSSPGRILKNKTFMMAVIIDFLYMVAGNLRGLYLSSYVYITQEWSVQNWTYYNNTLTLSLCVFGIIIGLAMRYTHRYKYWQVAGLSIKIIGVGILLNGHRATSALGPIIASPILIGAGGSFSVVSSRIASQASVPHQDTALVIALLALWSKIGSSVGSAIAAVIWSEKMPAYLREELPASVNDTQVLKFFGNIKLIRVYDYDSEIRQGAIRAYERTLWYLIVPALCLSFLPLIASLFQTNYFLGKQQNAVHNVGTDGEVVHDERVKKDALVEYDTTTLKGKFLKFWAGK
ncbi:major facilitator superfamily domain-containing protein [Schizophyllum amplum]|uniref:Major facilitator superfamily domain-containing protein n=1 Tax=Schizophyllum amplum TaxID=97359 RepID=A0A550C3K2_9AGAR|nr:major facilitator superfamily domain-containing protein [Auriculariopsis ampla]